MIRNNLKLKLRKKNPDNKSLQNSTCNFYIFRIYNKELKKIQISNCQAKLLSYFSFLGWREAIQNFLVFIP